MSNYHISLFLNSNQAHALISMSQPPAVLRHSSSASETSIKIVNIHVLLEIKYLQIVQDILQTRISYCTIL